MKRRTFLTTSAIAAVGATAGLRVAPVAAAGHDHSPAIAAAQSFKVGDTTVTAFSDGFLPIDATAMIGISPEDFAQRLAASFRDGTAHMTGVNAYLVETGDSTVLIDTGTGPAFGPTLGQLPVNMAALGVDLNAIDTVVATHLHPDHIGGVIVGESNPFPNARLVVGAADVDFWQNDDIKAQAPESARGFFDMASGALARFGDKVEPVTGEADLGNGLTTLPLPGHTVGHTGVMIESAGDAMLIWGDIVHVPPVQFAQPDVTIGFDTDQDQARATRQKVLDMVASDRLKVGGMHIDFPGVGFVETAGDGYRFVPAPYPYG